MLASANDVFQKVRQRIGVLARRFSEPLTAPTADDEDVLRSFVEEGLSQLAARTDRFRAAVLVRTNSDDPSVGMPPHIHRIDVASLADGDQSYELTKKAGRTVAKRARAEGASTGRPVEYGVFGTSIFFYPVPDEVYEVDFLVSLNGYTEPDTGEAAWFFLRPEQLFPFGESKTNVLTLDEMVKRVPNELTRGLVAYVLAEWLRHIGQAEASAFSEERFERDLRTYEYDPDVPSTTERPYNPLGL